ncbi:MAG: 5'/3'-nucleotidase SurE [Deltaproteobacteria bacterium]|nr:5'/3'-nucleotidase SurE [Deltaproteobacteria bacterium]
MLILLSNDDGVSAPGLRALAETLHVLGRVVVVAPDRERSAVGHALTLHKPLRVHELGEDVYSVNGTPTDCVTLAVNTILPGKPDLLISGINRGANLGDNITYSGTVAAAMEGALLGIPSMAVSVVGEGHFRYGEAAKAALRLARKIADHGLPADTFLNMNVPSLPAEQLSGIRITSMGRRTFKDPVVEKKDPRGRAYYWIGGEEIISGGKGHSDYEAIAENGISVTPLHLDLTHYEVFEKMESILFEGD